MKKICYKYIYQLLLIISNQFNNQYINRYKLFIGTALLLSASGCQEIKKKSKEEEKEDIQISDTLQIEKQDEDSIACYTTTEEQETPKKRRRRQTIESEEEIINYVPRIVERVEEIDVTCYDGIIVCYTGGESMPQFPGGKDELMKYITSNLKYPQSCIDDEIQGRVIIQFTVDKGGCVTNPKVLLSPSAAFNDEVIRVINQMPKWIPGRAYSKPVKINYTIPITFKIVP